MLFKNLRNRLLLINLLTISIVMMVTFFFIYSMTSSNMFQENYERIHRIPFDMKEGFRNPSKLENDIPVEFDGNIPLVFTDNYNISFNLLVTEDGVVDKISSSLELKDEDYQTIVDGILLNDMDLGTVAIGETIWMYEISDLVTIISSEEVVGNSQYRISFLDVTSTYSTLSDLIITLIIIGVIMLIVIYFISLYFANRSIKPIEVMWLKQKQFVADATHELKTPLTIINANIDAVLINEKDTIRKQRKWLDYIKIETKGMNKLVNQLLVTAKSEEEEISLNKINVNDIVKEAVVSFESLAFEKGITIGYKDNKYNVFGNNDKLLQVMKILLDNAVKYSFDNTKIKISCYKERKYVYIKVVNSGLGITQEDLPYVFDRFYKSDKARTNIDNSYGLGLFIAKQIMLKLKGDIKVESVLNEETVFTLKLRNK